MPRPAGRSGGLTPLLLSLLRRAASEAGQTGFEAVVITLVGGAVIVGSALLIDTSYVTDRLAEVTRASLDRVSGSLEVRGAVVVTAAGEPLAAQAVHVTLGTLGVTPPVSLEWQAEDSLVLTYRDAGAFAAGVPYQARFLTGNGDGRMDAGELVLLTVRWSDVVALTGKAPPQAGESFALELTSPAGVTLTVDRRLPQALAPVMALP